MRTYDNIQKIATGQGHDYTSDCLLDYPFFEEHNLIALDLSKQQAINAHLKTWQQIHFTGNLDGEGNINLFSITEEAKENILDFSQGTIWAL